MVMATKTPQGARLNPQNTLELSQGMSIQTAIDTADAHGGNWTLLLYPGTYDEADLTPNGGADITIKGMGEGRVVINPTVTVPVTAVIVSGFTLLLEDITVTARDAALPALRVTGGACEACDCELNGVGVGDAIQMVAGTLLLNDSEVPVGDVDLSTAGCTLTAIDTNFDGTIDTAGAAVAHTVAMFNCDLGGQALNLAATGACAHTFHNCMNMSTITDASLGGTGHLCQCDVVGAGLVVNGTSAWIVDNAGLVAVSNTNAAATIAIYGGVILAITRAVGSVVWWESDVVVKVLPCQTITDTVIAWALAAAAAVGERVEVHLAPGQYEEDSLVAADDCTIIGSGHAVETGSYIRINSANAMLTCGAVQFSILNCRIIQLGAGDCFDVTNAAGVLHLDRVSFGSAGQSAHMTAGTIEGHDCTLTAGTFQMDTAACELHAHEWDISGNIVTGGNFDHVLELDNCNHNGSVITNAATGATAIEIWNCSNILTLTDASLAGTLFIEHSSVTTATKTGTSPWVVRVSNIAVLSNTNATGAITLYAGLLLTLTRAVGPVVWWWDANTFKVIPSGTTTDTVIQWAINAAAAGDTVLLHPGTYDEEITLAAGINLVGIDKEGCLVDVTDGNTGITMAEGCRVANFSMLVTASGGNSRGIECNNAGAVATPLNIEDLTIRLVRTGGNAYGISEVTGNGVRVIYLRDVLILSDTDTNEYAIWCDQANKTFYIEKSWVQGGDYAIYCDAASIFYVDFTHLEVNVVPPGGGTTISCAAATMYFRTCTIEKQISVGDLGTVRLKGCSYREINRFGTGCIVDESPALKDAPWKVHKWDWMTALANMDVAVRGTPLDAGSGQVLLGVTDNVVGREAVETNPPVGGAHGNQFSPERTPRFITQVSFQDTFDPHTTMFFGLRATLSDYIPGVAEDHAGFDWDGTNFRATSSDGGGVGQQTNLASPSLNIHHQLEVIIIGVQVEFYVDGILVATHTDAAGIPNAIMHWQHLLETAGAGGGDAIIVTIRNGGCQECPA